MSAAKNLSDDLRSEFDRLDEVRFNDENQFEYKRKVFLLSNRIKMVLLPYKNFVHIIQKQIKMIRL